MLRGDIQAFLQAEAFGVVGTSNRRHKFGNKVLRCYLQHGKNVVPVHPLEKQIENIPCVAHVADLPSNVKSLSIITQPSVTEKIVEEAISKGIQNIWMQPGAESEKAISRCMESGINLIAGGPCILVVLGFVNQ